MPGLNRLDYNGDYWPQTITSVHDDDLLDWIEAHLYLITLGPRETTFNVLENTVINQEHAEALQQAALQCWDALIEKDLKNVGKYFKESFDAQVRMFPNMLYDGIPKIIKKYQDGAYGWKLSGAGGGGYLIFVAEKPIKGAMQIKIRRKAP
jgi:galactokinase/mevalonate kinase-like predicted kinase